MTNFHSYLLLGLGLATGLGSATIGSFASRGVLDGPLLVIAAPWNGGPAAVVARAGGQIVGPDTAPLAVFATDTTATALKSAGAWFVTTPSALQFLCTPETLV